jgi:regulator of sigma E protease
MIITTILVIIFLVILILGHELGHFAMAKLFGIRVDEFGFGFAPKIWGKKIGETEYTLNALPLGGFVRLYGENGEDDGGAPKTDEDRKRNFTLAPIWKRVVVLVGGVTMNFIIAWIAFSIVFMIGVPQAVYVEQVAANSPAETAGIAIGDEMIGFSDVDMFIEYVASHKGETLALEIRREGKEITVPVQVRAEVPEGEGAMGVQITAAGYESQGFFGGLKE